MQLWWVKPYFCINSMHHYSWKLKQLVFLYFICNIQSFVGGQTWDHLCENMMCPKYKREIWLGKQERNKNITSTVAVWKVIGEAGYCSLKWFSSLSTTYCASESHRRWRSKDAKVPFKHHVQIFSTFILQLTPITCVGLSFSRTSVLYRYHTGKSP